MENDILSIIKAIADEAVSNSESNGVEQSKKRKFSTMNGQNDDNFNESKAENEKLKKTIENQNETIKKQALIISQLIEKSRSVVAVVDDGNDQKAKAISAIGNEIKSKHVARNGERNKFSHKNHGSTVAAAGADTNNEAKIIEKTLERITEATSWMQSEIIYLEQLYKNESKEKQRWKTMALNLLKEANALKEREKEGNKEIVNSIINTVFNNQEQQPQLPAAVQQSNNFNVVTLDEIYNGVSLNCARLTSQTLLNVNKMTAAEKDCWNIYFHLNPLEYLNIAIGKLFKKSEFKLQLSGKFICNTELNTKKRIEEISHRIQSCSLTDLQIMNQNINYIDYQKLLSSKTINNFCFKNVTVYGEYNEVLEIDEILKELPNVKNFEYWFRNFNEVTPETAKLISCFSRFINLKTFKLCNVSRMFDLFAFSVFIRRHENVKFILEYRWQQDSARDGILAIAKKLIIPSSCSLIIEFAKP